MVMGDKITTQLTHASFCLFCSDVLVCLCVPVCVYMSVLVQAGWWSSRGIYKLTPHNSTQKKAVVLVC